MDNFSSMAITIEPIEYLDFIGNILNTRLTAKPESLHETNNVSLDIDNMSPDIYNWINEKNTLQFYNIYQAVHAFSKAVFFNDYEKMVYSYGSITKKDCDITVDGFDETIWANVVFKLEMYFYYNLVLQWDGLRHYVLTTKEPLSLSLVYVRELIIHSTTLEKLYKNELRRETIDKILKK